MRILAAFFFMSLIGIVATVLAVISALIQMLPVILVAAAVFGIVRWRRRAAADSNAADRPVSTAIIPARPAPLRPIGTHPDGWVMVPVWMPPPGVPDRHHHIDAEIINEDDHHA